MKIILAALCIFQVLSSFGQTSIKPNEQIIIDIREKEKAAIGKTFPAFQGISNGKLINNEVLKGKTVLVNFWFEACAPCIAEFDALNELYNKLKGNENFEFVSFTYETPAKIAEIKAKYNINYKIISIERGDCYRLNQNNGFPTNLILSKDQKITYLIAGGNVDKDQASAFIMTEIYPKVLQEL